MSHTKLARSGRIALLAAAGLAAAVLPARAKDDRPALRAGAHAIDITPKTFPVIVNGSFLERRATRAVESLHARCLVLDDGKTRIAIAVVDVIGMPREMLDAVKEQVRKSTGIATSHILISATHTHSAPAVLGALGSDRDEAYSRYLPPLLAKGIEKANVNLEPARVGWAVAKDHEHTHCRRWIYRPDRMGRDPFGEITVRANMHPGYQNPSCVGPSGPTDPDITMLSVQSKDGRPIALLANYCMHYYGAPAVSSDYYGPFCAALARLIGAEKCDPPFVAIMSHGTSGEQHWMDYSKPKRTWGSREKYAELVARMAVEAYQKVDYQDNAIIQMAEQKFTLGRRVPDEKRLAWAKAILAKMGDRKPRTKPEVYAREAILLHEEPTRELKLQAVRIGGLGITAIPNEVYALTGLKLKAQSPLQPTMNIELANGCEGYIPPPAQHALGGYNTWPARTAGLEVQAEPKIVETVLRLLEQVSGKSRRKVVDPEGPYVEAVRASKPIAYWRMSEFDGPRAVDASGKGNQGTYEDGVAFYLRGPEADGLRGPGHINRAAHFAGGRMRAVLPNLGQTYSVELWFWNGLPSNARAVTGYLFSVGPNGDGSCPGDHLGIGGAHLAKGKLFFFNGNRDGESLEGSTRIPLRTWQHAVFVRDGKRVKVYLNGNCTLEIASEAEISRPANVKEVFVGGRCDSFANWEGKLAEVAVYNRALTSSEVALHQEASVMSRLSCRMTGERPAGGPGPVWGDASSP